MTVNTEIKKRGIGPQSFQHLKKTSTRDSEARHIRAAWIAACCRSTRGLLEETVLLQNLAECKVLQRTRCRTVPNARFCNGPVAEPCKMQGSATDPLQNLARCKVLQRTRCRTMQNARFCNGEFADVSWMNPSEILFQLCRHSRSVRTGSINRFQLGRILKTLPRNCKHLRLFCRAKPRIQSKLWRIVTAKTSPGWATLVPGTDNKRRANK